MSQKEQTLMTPYLQFNRHQWAALRDSVPMTLTEEEITRLKGINEDLWKRLPRFICRCRVCSTSISVLTCVAGAVLEQFLGTNGQRIPYIISIAGSVAVGKAPPPAFCKLCLVVGRSIAMSNSLPPTVLHPNSVLKERGLMKKKAFRSPMICIAR